MSAQLPQLTEHNVIHSADQTYLIHLHYICQASNLSESRLSHLPTHLFQVHSLATLLATHV